MPSVFALLNYFQQEVLLTWIESSNLTCLKVYVGGRGRGLPSSLSKETEEVLNSCNKRVTSNRV